MYNDYAQRCICRNVINVQSFFSSFSASSLASAACMHERYTQVIGRNYVYTVSTPNVFCIASTASYLS